MKITEETHLEAVDVDRLVAVLTSTLLIIEELKFKTTAQSRAVVRNDLSLCCLEIVGVLNAARIDLGTYVQGDNCVEEN